MLKSMTGFGRAVYDAPFGRLTVEIQSVNRKYFEVFIALPKEWCRFETEVRKWVGETLSRGQVSVKVQLIPSLAAMETLLPDAKMLKGLKKGWEKLARNIGADPQSIDLSFLLQYLPPGQREAREKDLPALQRCMEEALKELLKMKTTEGKALAADLEGRLKNLAALIAKIEKYAPDATRKMQEKLKEKMAEVAAETDERLLKEVAFFAEKVDITEEITRFRSHLAQFKPLLKEEAIGRKMEFLLQEMGREVNTIGSKSMEAKISHLVVEMKSELEKMREQVQNIE